MSANGEAASREDDRRESSDRASGERQRIASREDDRRESSMDASGKTASHELDAPTDLLDAHPETAYFWGRAVGDGEVTAESVTVRTNDEIAAERLAAVAGADSVNHRSTEREYAHDTSITRSEDTYTVRIHGPVGDRAAAAFGLPLEEAPGGYRLDALAEYDRQLLRGLLEGCGTVCFKSSSGTVGISFVAADRKLLERIAGLLDSADVDAPYGEISETSSGGHWFGLDDEAAPDVGAWLYRDCAETGLFAPTRRRKLRRSIEEADAY
jgi:hypothetical protein